MRVMLIVLLLSTTVVIIHGLECIVEDKDNPGRYKSVKLEDKSGVYCGFNMTVDANVCLATPISRGIVNQVGVETPPCQKEGFSLFCFCKGNNCNRWLSDLRSLFVSYLSEHGVRPLVGLQWIKCLKLWAKFDWLALSGHYSSSSSTAHPLRSTTGRSTTATTAAFPMETTTTTERPTTSTRTEELNENITEGISESTTQNTAEITGLNSISPWTTPTDSTSRPSNTSSVANKTEALEPKDENSSGVQGWHIAAIVGALVLAAILMGAVVIIVKKWKGRGKKEKKQEKPSGTGKAAPRTAITIEKPVATKDPVALPTVAKKTEVAVEEPEMAADTTTSLITSEEPTGTLTGDSTTTDSDTTGSEKNTQVRITVSGFQQ